MAVETRAAQGTKVTGPYGFEYARLAVPDLDASKRWYEKYVGLEPCGESDGHNYLRAGLPHHSLDLIEDKSLKGAEVRAFGFSVESEEALEALKRRVKAAGAPIKELDEAQKLWCANGFATVDPAGNTLEFFTEFQEWAERPYRAYTPDYIVHPFIGTPKYEETLKFYTDVIGFRPSDYIANMTAFLRSENRLHHSLAVRRAKEREIAHICFAMGSLDQVMRGRALAVYDKVKIAADMANHSASKSIAFYIEDPKHGPRIELCNGHRRLTEEEHEHEKPRRMSVDPRNIDVWRAAADDWHDL